MILTKYDFKVFIVSLKILRISIDRGYISGFVLYIFLN